MSATPEPIQVMTQSEPPTESSITAGHDKTRGRLSIITVSGLFVYLILITIYPIPAANQRFADIALGFLFGTAGASIYGFYYGTSVGSESKSATISKKLGA